MKSFAISTVLALLFVLTLKFGIMSIHLETLPEITWNVGKGWKHLSKESNTREEEFPIVYIGNKKNHIKLSSDPSYGGVLTDLEPDFSLLLALGGRNINKYCAFDYFPKLSAENWKVQKKQDVTLIIGSPVKMTGEGKRYLQHLSVRPIYLVNRCEDTVFAGGNGDITGLLEIQKNHGWIEKYDHFPRCGTDSYAICLPPGKIAIALGCFTPGETCRLRYGDIISNSVR